MLWGGLLCTQVCLAGITDHFSKILHSKQWDIYLPAYTWHLPFLYDAEKRHEYNSYPLGFGIGKSIINDHNNWEGVYGLGFQDSHTEFQFMLGYNWNAMWSNSFVKDLTYGIGYTVFLMSRKDIMHYIPFPGILPTVNLTYKSLSLGSTYIPGLGRNDGNVLFFWLKCSL
jgi:lipid IVA palmitoyltransferase